MSRRRSISFSRNMTCLQRAFSRLTRTGLILWLSMSISFWQNASFVSMARPLRTRSRLGYGLRITGMSGLLLTGLSMNPIGFPGNVCRYLTIART